MKEKGLSRTSKIYQLKYNPGLEDGLGYQSCQNRMEWPNLGLYQHRPFFLDISLLGLQIYYIRKCLEEVKNTHYPMLHSTLTLVLLTKFISEL